VLQEGEVGGGDELKLIDKDPNNVSVSDITRLYVRDKANTRLLRRAIAVEALPESWRTYFDARLQKLIS
jgi:MOSC domain-containing protein YiiM